MLESTAAYKSAVTGTVRRTYVRAAVGIIDPDIVFTSVDGSAQASYSQPEQVYDTTFDSGDTVMSLGLNRVMLDGSFTPLQSDDVRQVGYVGQELSGDDGSFANTQTVTLNFDNVDVLQAITLGFSTKFYDGVPRDFTVTCGSQSWSYADNTLSRIIIEDFTVDSPTDITLQITKWSLPSRRVRVIEIYPGLYEEWTLDDLYALSVTQQANFASTALPYGTCQLSVDNTDRRFEPSNPEGIFKSIEDRQGVDISIGVELSSGVVEYKHIGKYYQYSGGWKTGRNAMTIDWSLVDIIGLLSSREYIPPTTLPTTADGWIASIVGQLGTLFTNAYAVDESLASKSLSPDSRANVTGRKCSDLITWVALAAGGYAVADNRGRLAVKALSTTGGSVTLDNIADYPTVSANQDLAFISFTLHDGNATQYIVDGTAEASSNTISVDNPFIKTQTAADAAAAIILAFYGGNAYSTTGRGDPASEVGDVDTLSITDEISATARRVSQTFAYSEGVLQGCQATYIEVKKS